MTARTQRVTSVTRSLPALVAEPRTRTAEPSASMPASPPPTRESDMHHIPEQMARSQILHRQAEAAAWRIKHAARAARRAEEAERRARLAREAAVLAHQAAYASAR
jgi:hypothetical protein